MSTIESSIKGEPYVLGLDIGINSIGWAAVKLTKGKETGLLKVGVRIFPQGMEGDIEKGRDASRALPRREARMHRRILDRRRRRLIRLAHLLQKLNILPAGDLLPDLKRQEYLRNLDTSLIKEHELAEYPHTWLYKLRALALDQQLPLKAIGRIFCHLAQRRGFKSGRREAAEKQDEKGEIKKSIGVLGKEIESAGARTLGEYFASLDPSLARIRGRYTSRQMYLAEFGQIWISQNRFYPDLLTPETKRMIEKAIFYQRPLKSSRRLIGNCELEHGEPRYPMSCLATQRFRMLQKVNDLRIIIRSTGEIRALLEEERKTLLAELEHESSLSFAKIRKLLSLNRLDTFNFAMDDDERGLIGNKTNALILPVLGASWETWSDEDRNALVDEMRLTMKEEVFVRRTSARWKLHHHIAQEIWNASMKMEDSHCALSRKAIEKVLPLLEKGESFATARKAAYGESRISKPVDYLPPVDMQEVFFVRNPAVHRALTQLSKVVNAVIRSYGKPEVIRVELARDLRRSRGERQDISREQGLRGKAREKARQNLIDNGISNPKGTDIEKWLLAEECRWECPYTGKTISPKLLIGPHQQFDVEHIIPWHRSLDNSFLNKILCAAEENRNRKQGRTPWEAYGSDTERWKEILLRVSNLQGDAREAKLRRFQMESTEDLEDFTHRHLNDTRYASLLAMEYLGFLYGADKQGVDASRNRRIQAGRGTMTKFIRDELELNAILGEGYQKNRGDHRQHAVDAVAIALTSSAMIKRLSVAAQNAYKLGHRRFDSLEPPWPTFQENVREGIAALLVSHQPQRKVQGALHDATFLSLPTRAKVRVRKPLASMTIKEVDKIVDPKIKEIVKKALDGRDPGKAFAEGQPFPMLKTKDGRKIPIKKARIYKSDKIVEIGDGHRKRFAVSGGNHHIEIIERHDHPKHPWEGRMVNLLDATRRVQAGLPVVKREHGTGTRFVMSLCAQDIIELDSEKGTRELYLIRSTQQMTTNPNPEIKIVPITDARLKADQVQDRSLVLKSMKSLKELGCKKVTITPLGEIRRAND